MLRNGTTPVRHFFRHVYPHLASVFYNSTLVSQPLNVMDAWKLHTGPPQIIKRAARVAPRLNTELLSPRESRYSVKYIALRSYATYITLLRLRYRAQWGGRGGAMLVRRLIKPRGKNATRLPSGPRNGLRRNFHPAYLWPVLEFSWNQRRRARTWNDARKESKDLCVEVDSYATNDRLWIFSDQLVGLRLCRFSNRFEVNADERKRRMTDERKARRCNTRFPGRSLVRLAARDPLGTLRENEWPLL